MLCGLFGVRHLEQRDLPASSWQSVAKARAFKSTVHLTHERAHKTAAHAAPATHAYTLSKRTKLRVLHTTRTHHSSTMTAKDDTVASKAEEEFVLLGDPEKTTALPDLPRTTEPADKQNKTIVADMTACGGDSNKQDKTFVEATHADTYEKALKEAAPDAPPSIGDAAAALKDATIRELGAAREKASTKIKEAARAARQNAPAWRRVGRWALGLLALAFVFAGGFFLGDRRGGRRSVAASAPVADTAPPSVNEANAQPVAPTNPLANEPPADPSSTNDASPQTCRTRPSVDSLFDGVVNDILGLRSQPRPRRADAPARACHLARTPSSPRVRRPVARPGPLHSAFCRGCGEAIK